ncbi:MAG: M20/M25/M40 family metallo-hydrolase, partial [Methylococcaceae bacterium]|nr:M20/M25/M40 family metallo-hydrolase [Methylococcaceae bacterium]
MNRHVRALIHAGLLAFLCAEPARAERERGPGKILELSRAVNFDRVKFHQRMLQQIARQNKNNRAAGTKGYEQSSKYVSFWLRMAGYPVQIQKFKFPFYQELSAPLLRRIFPQAEPYPASDPRGFYTLVFSASGDVEGAVVPVDVVMPPGETANTSNSGCEAEDFAFFPAGAIALIQRGTCSYDDKAKNAQAAGASAVIFYNEGQVDRTDATPASFGLLRPAIPAVFASYAIGQELYELARQQEIRVRLKTRTLIETRTTHNILAATRAGAHSRKVIVGAHLDSVIDGPGINDNGSGAAAILEVATKLAGWGMRPKYQLVFAFWGAEELGTLGSIYYLSQLPKEALAGISLYLNFDMIGSPNGVRFVYDGDGSD